LHDDFGAVLVGFEKFSHGKTRFLPALPESVFETDDTVFIVAEMEQARQLSQALQLEELPHLDERTRAEALQELGTAELMLAPESKLIGKRLVDIDFRSRYHVSVLAIRRRGEALTTDLVNRSLDFGDTLLVAGDWAEIGKLWDDRDDFVVLTLPAEYQERLPARQHAPLAIAILVVMVAVMAFGVIPNAAAALLAALAMIAGGCVRLDAIYRIISWKTVVLIAGMLPPGDSADQDRRNRPDGERIGGGVGIARADRDAGGGISGRCAGRTVCFELGDCGFDRSDCDRRRPNIARFAICVCDDGVDRLLRRLRDTRFVSGEHAGDGTCRLRLWRLCQGGFAAAVADNARYYRAGRGDLSPLGRSALAQQKWWEQHVEEPIATTPRR
jgi:K+/H+ antiporter YhaU regulatory subunit KhtT